MWKDMMKDMGLLGFISYILVLVGGLAWGLYGIFQINIISMIFGGLGRIIGIVIGAGAGYLIYTMVKKKTPA